MHTFFAIILRIFCMGHILHPAIHGGILGGIGRFPPRVAPRPRFGRPILPLKDAPLAKKATRRRNAKRILHDDTAARIRLLAQHVRLHAELIDAYADAVEGMEIDDLNVLTGKFYRYLEGIRDFANTQLQGKIVKSPRALGAHDHEIFARLHQVHSDLIRTIEAEQNGSR